MIRRILITENQLENIIDLYNKNRDKILTKRQILNLNKSKLNEDEFGYGNVGIKNPDTFDKSKLRYGSTPFKNSIDGNKFRKYVNDKYPNIAKGIDLDREGEPNNEYIQVAWNYNVDGKTLGERYVDGMGLLGRATSGVVNSEDNFDRSKLKYGSTPFNNPTDGNKFRKFVNDEYPNIAKGINLDREGEPNNGHIQLAWNYNVAGKTLGERFKENKFYSRDVYKTEPVKTVLVPPSEEKPVPDYIKNAKGQMIKHFEKDSDKPIKDNGKKYCPRITPQSNIKDVDLIFNSNLGSKDYLWGGGSFASTTSSSVSESEVNDKLNSYAGEYINQGIPNRTACQAALNKIRPTFHGKNMIIVDSLNKLIYVFDKDNNFIAKDVIISGFDKQSNDTELIARSLLTWDEECNQEGFKYVTGKGYVDVTGKNRKYDPELIYAATARDKARFLPAGIFNTASNLETEAGYAGISDNLISLTDENKKELSQAIHGYYLEQPRTQALNMAKAVLSDPTNPKVSKEFLDLVASKSINLSQSYGCINLPPSFLPILRKYMKDSYVFNVSENEENYLVQNTDNYFNKTTNSPVCPSPKSVGAEEPIEFTA